MMPLHLYLNLNLNLNPNTRESKIIFQQQHEDDKVSNEPDYDKYKDQPEEEQEEQTGKQQPSSKFSKLILRDITTVQAMAIVKD